MMSDKDYKIRLKHDLDVLMMMMLQEMGGDTTDFKVTQDYINAIVGVSWLVKMIEDKNNGQEK